MSDMSSMSRENKKRRLRRRMITSQQVPPQAEFYPWNEEDEEAAGSGRQKVARRRMLVLLIVSLATIIAVGAWLHYRRNHRYTGYETSWEVPLEMGSLVGYEIFGNNMLKYTKDGASYIDNHGKNVWIDPYQMKAPIISVNGDYAAIAEQQGNIIYIYNAEGRQGEAHTALPIRKVAISGTGVVTAVLEDSTSSCITFYEKDGSVLDRYIRMYMAGDGYPLDIALAGDGTQLLCSYVYLKGGEMKSRVVFYDFSEIGKSIPTRVVGGFDEPFAGTMVPKVIYMKEPYSCAFTGNGPAFFSSKNLASPKLISQASMAEDTIKSICYSDDYVGVIVHNNNGEFTSRLEVFGADGRHVMSKEFSYEYTGAQISGDMVILYNEDSCKVFNMSGVEKMYITFDFPVSRIRMGRFGDTMIVAGPQLMREIRLQ